VKLIIKATIDFININELLFFRMLRRGFAASRRSAGSRALNIVQRFRTLGAPKWETVPKRCLSVTMSRMLPEHEMIVLPALSPTMETGTIKQWEVSTFYF